MTLIGYARVSTRGQLLDRQLAALTEAGCIRIFADKVSGKNTDREELTKALDHLRPGDALVVPSLDRLARSLQEALAWSRVRPCVRRPARLYCTCSARSRFETPVTNKCRFRSC
jgi:DNA invertase Pin-like site-specific DNA recombinase